MPFLNIDLPSNIGAFKTPTLRNIFETAPYGHDGRFATLDEVLEHYSRLKTISSLGMTDHILRPLVLTSQEKINLLAFLRSLTSAVEYN